MPEGSGFWQVAFLGWVGVTLLWSVWSGWRRGIVRALVSLVGLVAGAMVGSGVGAAAPVALGWLVPLPGALIGLLCGLAAGLVVWIGIVLIGAVLFKRTEHQPSFLLRIFYGGGGALVGLVMGVTMVWGGLMLVRGLGAFSEGRFGEVARYYNVPEPGVLERAVVRLKQSIEEGATGELLTAVDVVPESTYRVLEKMGRVVVDPTAMQRFLEVPEVAAITGDAKFSALTADPDVSEAARSGEYETLLTNEKVIAMANDPGLVEKLKKIELEAALDHALVGQPPVAPTRENGAGLNRRERRREGRRGWNKRARRKQRGEGVAGDAAAR